MRDFLRSLDWQDWLRGLVAAITGGGANAVVAGIGINVADPAHFNAQNAVFYRTVGSVFAVGAVISFFLYLKQNPLPPKLVSKTTATLTVEKTVSREAVEVKTDPKSV